MNSAKQCINSAKQYVNSKMRYANGHIESGLVKRFENPKLCYNIWREEINKILVAKTLRNIYNRKIRNQQ